MRMRLLPSSPSSLPASRLARLASLLAAAPFLGAVSAACNVGGADDALATSSHETVATEDSSEPRAGWNCLVGTDITRPCGQCGSQLAHCLPIDESIHGKLAEFGKCEGEHGECLPEEMRTCPTGGSSLCTSECKWTSECSVAERDKLLTIDGMLGGTVSGSYALSTTQVGKRGPAYCDTAIEPQANYPYEVIELANPTSQIATVTVTLSAPELVQMLNAYPTSPETDEELAACTAAYWGTDISIRVMIPAKGNIFVRTSSFAPVTEPASTGKFMLTVRTDRLQ